MDIEKGLYEQMREVVYEDKEVRLDGQGDTVIKSVMQFNDGDIFVDGATGVTDEHNHSFSGEISNGRFRGQSFQRGFNNHRHDFDLPVVDNKVDGSTTTNEGHVHNITFAFVPREF